VGTFRESQRPRMGASSGRGFVAQVWHTVPAPPCRPCCVASTLTSRHADIEARWECLSIAGRRQIVSALMDVRLNPSTTKGRWSLADYDRVEIGWR